MKKSIVKSLKEAQELTDRISEFESAMFGKLRVVVMEDGKTFFNLPDVCQALTLANVTRVKMRMSKRGVTTVSTPTSNQFGASVLQPTSYIDEPNLYRCIFMSRKAEAEKFQNWVFEEVLPQIRQTGGYIPTRNPRTGKALTDTEIVNTANKILKSTIARKNHPADDCFTATEIAKELGMEANELNHILYDKGIIRWTGARYQLTPDYAEQGYDENRLFCYHSKEGEAKQRTYLVWTPKGREFVLRTISRPTPNPSPRREGSGLAR